jgi:UPF0271 protein
VRTIDLNFDGGEGEDDAALMPFVTTVNVACGAHAGDGTTMRATVRLARAGGVSVFAHPSYPDRENFGRRRMTLPAADVERLVREQVDSLLRIAKEEGAEVAGVKPHGGLYHAAASDGATAGAFVAAVRAVSPALVVVSSPGSKLIAAARAAGMRSVAEGFADRGYEADGSLVARGTEGALLTDPAAAAAQALAIACDGAVTKRAGTRLPVAAGTICLHGDTPGAPAIAKAVRGALENAGFALRSLSAPSSKLGS